MTPVLVEGGSNTTTIGGSVVAGDVPVLATPLPVSLLVPLLGGNPLAGATVLACLTTADVNSLRRLHPALLAIVADAPWADTDAAVVNVVRWRAVLPAAVGARLTLRSVMGAPARAAAALAGVTHLDLQGGDYVRVNLLSRLPASVRVLNVSGCRNLAGNASFTHLPALEVLKCSRTTVVCNWAGGLPSSLQELDVTDAYDLRSRVSLAHLCTLRVLRAARSALGNATLASLPPSLVELHVAQCRNLSPAASFGHLPALRVRDVSGCRIGDESLASLPLSLVRLNACLCSGLTLTAAVSHLPRLQWLDVGYTAIGDALVASLPPSLAELRLTSCYNVTRTATLDHLPALRQLHSMGSRLDRAVLTACRAHGCVAPSAAQLLLKTWGRLPLVVLADGRLACALPDCKVQLWDLARAVGTAAVVIKTDGEVYSLAPLPDGRLAVGTAVGCIEVWDVKATPPVRCSTIVWVGHGDVGALASLADGRLAATRFGNSVWIIDVDAGTATVLEGHTAETVSLMGLPDGRLACGLRNATVQIWDVSARACVATLEGHTDEVRHLAVLADGRLASGTYTGTVRLWDVNTATCVGVRQGSGSSLAALTDGRLAIRGNIIRVWDTRPTAAATPDVQSEPVSEVSLDLTQLLGRTVNHTQALVPLQDGRLACVCLCSEEPYPGWAMCVYLLDVPPPGACLDSAC